MTGSNSTVPTGVGIDEYSIVPAFLEMHCPNSSAIGTGFTYRVDGRTYLITNWHNLTGRNPQTGALLSGGVPNRIVALFHLLSPLGQPVRLTLPLNDANDEPIWFEHRLRQQGVDVAAIPIDVPSGVSLLPINEASALNWMPVHVGSDLFILGFPFGISASSLPIWKRGSLASEPDVDLDGLPKMLIDSATRPGMSGSPVILRNWGSFSDGPGIVTIPGSGTRFLGVYSGRIGADDELKAQLGIVWKAIIVDEVIAQGIRGTV